MSFKSIYLIYINDQCFSYLNLWHISWSFSMKHFVPHHQSFEILLLPRPKPLDRTSLRQVHYVASMIFNHDYRHLSVYVFSLSQTISKQLLPSSIFFVDQLFFHSVVFPTTHFFRALPLLGDPAEPWILPSRYDPRRPSMSWYHSPTKIRESWWLCS